MLNKVFIITERQQFYSDDEQSYFSNKYHALAFSNFINDGEI